MADGWIDSLAEKLAAATPGPWIVAYDGIVTNGTVAVVRPMSDAVRPADAELIVALRNHGEEMVELLREARELLAVFVSFMGQEDECYLDHHGYCQAHMMEDDCSVPKARAWLAKLGSGHGS